MSRILVIDDDPGNRLIVRSRLSDLGYEVLTEETGANGLVEARSSKIDLVMVAAGLGPGIDATEVCRRLKGIPETASIPLLIYSNLPANQEELARAYDAGCDVFVPKQELAVLDQLVRVQLRTKSVHDDLAEQVRVLEHQNRRLAEEHASHSDRELSQNKGGESSLVGRELAAGRPDGLLVVDGEGYVRFTDRGACAFFGNRVEGKNLGSLAPASGLEAFARDARTEAREGYRFDLPAVGGRSARQLSASVVPLVTSPGSEERGFKILLLLDAGKRRLAAEMLRVSDPGIPRQQLGALLDAARIVYRPESLVGESFVAQAARDAVKQFGKSRGPALLVGPEGSGKLHLARTLHYSASISGPFLQVHCGAIDGAELERELFGCTRNAAPNGSLERPGLVQRAADGTLLLEEVASMPAACQRRMLELLEKGSVTRVGAERTESVDVRLVATNLQPLADAVAKGRFLAELASKLAQITIHMAPLVERNEDVYALALYFLALHGAADEVREIDDETLSILAQHPWPGNVAELEDAIRSACALASNGVVTANCLPQSVLDSCEGLASVDLIPPKPRRREGRDGRGPSLPHPLSSLSASARRKHNWDITEEDPICLEHYEMKVLMRALDAVGGDKLAAARLLKVGKSTLYRKLKRFDLK